MKILIGVAAGVVVAFLCVFAIEALSHMVFPPPAGIDLTDPGDVARLMEVMPTAALAAVIAAWFLGSLAGAWTADRIAKRALAGWIVAVLVVTGGVYTMTTIPHPTWMWGAGILLPLAAGWLAQRMANAAT